MLTLLVQDVALAVDQVLPLKPKENGVYFGLIVITGHYTEV